VNRTSRCRRIGRRSRRSRALQRNFVWGRLGARLKRSRRIQRDVRRERTRIRAVAGRVSVRFVNCKDKTIKSPEARPGGAMAQFHPTRHESNSRSPPGFPPE
jgi:hypothetical protein